MFEGNIGDAKKIGDYEYELTLTEDLTYETEAGTFRARHCYSTNYTDPLGLDYVKAGSKLKVLTEGYPLSNLPEESYNGLDVDNANGKLDRICIYNEDEEVLFLGVKAKTKEEIKRFVIGRWGVFGTEREEYVFNEDGNFEIKAFNGEVLPGTWELNGDNVDFTIEEGTFTCVIPADYYELVDDFGNPRIKLEE